MLGDSIEATFTDCFLAEHAATCDGRLLLKPAKGLGDGGTPGVRHFIVTFTNFTSTLSDGAAVAADGELELVQDTERIEPTRVGRMERAR